MTNDPQQIRELTMHALSLRLSPDDLDQIAEAAARAAVSNSRERDIYGLLEYATAQLGVERVRDLLDGVHATHQLIVEVASHDDAELIDLVHDVAGHGASRTNNEGVAAQVHYLVRELGVDEARELIADAGLLHLGPH